jgi:hypothetical protein
VFTPLQDLTRKPEIEGTDELMEMDEAAVDNYIFKTTRNKWSAT